MNKKLIFGLILVATILLLGASFGQYLTLENAKVQQEALNSFIEANIVYAATVYFFSVCCDYRIFYSRSSSGYFARRSFVWVLV